MSRAPREGSATPRRKHTGLTIREIAIFAMLGALMAVSDLAMNILPNVHLVGVLTMVYTLAYRAKALFPIGVYLFLIGVFEGFGLWWLAYLYIWPILWGITMLLPRRMPRKVAPFVYTLVCGLHGFAFGFLWIPAQMLLLSFSFKQALIWWSAGFLTADVPNGIGNLVGSVLIVPLVTVIRKLSTARLR